MLSKFIDNRISQKYYRNSTLHTTDVYRYRFLQLYLQLFLLNLTSLSFSLSFSLFLQRYFNSGLDLSEARASLLSGDVVELTNASVVDSTSMKLTWQVSNQSPALILIFFVNFAFHFACRSSMANTSRASTSMRASYPIRRQTMQCPPRPIAIRCWPRRVPP